MSSSTAARALLVALKQQRHDPARIGLLLVSHLHAHRTRPLRVAGPAGVHQRVHAAMEVLVPGSTQVRRRFEVHFHELADRQPLQFGAGAGLAGLVVVPFEVVHASGATAFGLRVGWQGHTIAYTGDTEPTC
jgi:hypothetical protein